MKSTPYMMGFAMGLSFVVILSLIAIFTRKKNGKCKYDEMQERARGIAYKYAFFALIISEIIFGFSEEAGNLIPIEGMTKHFCIIMIGVLVHVSYSIWHNAYIGLNTKPKNYALLCGALAVVNLAIAFRGISQGNMIVNGKLDFPFINLVVGLLFITIGIQMIIKNLVDSKEE